MTHLDLFSGIGGFALAARWAGIETVQFVEIDPFCQKVLQKNFPGVPIHDDIKTFTYTEGRKSREQAESEWRKDIGRGNIQTNTDTNGNGLQGPWAKLKTDGNRQFVQERPSYSRNIRPAPFILTGGFPCQPFSCAGKRKGTEDDRYLWPEMLRVISEARPRWVIGENVGGFINMGLDDCISDLEAEGYEVQPFIIPACAKNAPHRRDRVWIVANCIDAPNTERISGRPGLRQNEAEQNGDQFTDGGGDAANTSNQRLQGSKRPGPHEQGQAAHGTASERNHAWDEPWIEAATRLCVVDDGLPGGLVRPRGWRVNALKAAGNAIVPQIAYEIMKAIVDTGETF